MKDDQIITEISFIGSENWVLCQPPVRDHKMSSIDGHLRR